MAGQEAGVRLPASKVKQEVRKRDGYRCTECGMAAQEYFEKFGKQLDVHRLDPGSRYTVDGCVTLCKTCHKSKPKKKRTRPLLDRRFTLVVEPSWVEKVSKAAKAIGLTVSAYIRYACNEKMQRDDRERNSDQ